MIIHVYVHVGIFLNLSRASVDNLTTDINSLANKLKNLSDQMTNVNQEFRDQMAEFLQVTAN